MSSSITARLPRRTMEEPQLALQGSARLNATQNLMPFKKAHVVTIALQGSLLRLRVALLPLWMGLARMEHVHRLTSVVQSSRPLGSNPKIETPAGLVLMKAPQIVVILV
jgi:hypothetical protein